MKAIDYLRVALGGNLYTDTLTQVAWLELMEGYGGALQRRIAELEEELAESREEPETMCEGCPYDI